MYPSNRTYHRNLMPSLDLLDRSVERNTRTWHTLHPRSPLPSIKNHVTARTNYHWRPQCAHRTYFPETSLSFITPKSKTKQKTWQKLMGKKGRRKNRFSGLSTGIHLLVEKQHVTVASLFSSAEESRIDSVRGEFVVFFFFLPLEFGN